MLWRIEDVSRHRAADDAVSSEYARQSRVVEEAPVGFYTLDEGGCILKANALIQRVEADRRFLDHSALPGVLRGDRIVCSAMPTDVLDPPEHRASMTRNGRGTDEKRFRTVQAWPARLHLNLAAAAERGRRAKSCRAFSSTIESC